LESFLDSMRYAHMAVYVIVFVVSLIKFPLYKNSALKVLPIILFFTLLTESLGWYIVNEYGPPNAIVYNIYYFFYFSLFYYVFLKTIDDKKFKLYIKCGIAVFWLFYASDWIFTDFIGSGFLSSYMAGAGILVFCIILYYINILQSSRVLVIKNDLLFWVSVGLFLFYIGYIPIKIIRSWFYKPDSFFEILLVIQFSLIIIMYLFFLTGFLWMKRRS